MGFIQRCVFQALFFRLHPGKFRQSRETYICRHADEIRLAQVDSLVFRFYPDWISFQDRNRSWNPLSKVRIIVNKSARKPHQPAACQPEFFRRYSQSESLAFVTGQDAFDVTIRGMHHGQLRSTRFEGFDVAGHGVVEECTHILASDHQSANALAGMILVVEIVRITVALVNVIHSWFSICHDTDVRVHFAERRKINFGTGDLPGMTNHVIGIGCAEDFVDQICNFGEIFLNKAALGQPGSAHADTRGA